MWGRGSLGVAFLHSRGELDQITIKAPSNSMRLRHFEITPEVIVKFSGKTGPQCVFK